ncbi:MAG TPA: exodeoxyribonuclease VII large subunit [Acidimicrobiales bacterium]|nr:exodeoxyribonuclease VII large subunit [Acidimicrobiales bacterium]
MTLPLFDDEAARSPRTLTLVRLAGEIARSLGGIGRVAVEGEVHRPTVSRGGWTFFTLRDRAAQVSVVVPATKARRCRAVSGERVCVTGGLQWSADRGQAQLVAEEIVPVGEGAIAALILETRRVLESEGLIGRNRRTIPVLPRAIGVVCGSDAAVRKDIESVVAARFPGYPLHFEETTVSGPGASVSIVDAMREVVSLPDVDVVIVARGGGDAPSLLPWSTEEVCRAVASCPVPVVSAIGHEGDRPLCDEVADLRCGTPSLAATAVVPDRDGLASALDAVLTSASSGLAEIADRAHRRISASDPGKALDAGLERASSRLVHAGQRLADCHPARRLDSCRSRLLAADHRRPAGEIIGRAAGRLAADLRHLGALSPQRTLERGYSITTGPEGRVLRRAADVGLGDPISVTLAEGRLHAQVTKVEEAGTSG